MDAHCYDSTYFLLRYIWIKPDKEKIKSLMKGDNLYVGKETNVLDAIIVFSILAMYNLIQTAI